MYATVIALVKASILALYWRIFPTRFMKISCYILGGVVIAWWMSIVVVASVECRPIQRAWTPSITEGVCIDTCHAFAAGYDLRSPEAFAKTMDKFDRVVGLKYLKAIHCTYLRPLL